MKRNITIFFLVLLCFGLISCDSDFGVMSFDPEFYIAIPKSDNIMEVRIRYETESFYVYKDREFFGEKISEDDIEYFSVLKNNSQDAVIWEKEQTSDYYYFPSITTDLNSRKNFYLQIEVHTLDNEKKEIIYTGIVDYSEILPQGDISEHNVYKNIELKSKDGKSLWGLFTYLLVISI